MTDVDPRQAADVLRAQIRECRDDLAQVTCQVQALQVEYDVKHMAYRIVCAERDEMRRCLVTVLGYALPQPLLARIRRLLERTTPEH